MKKSCKRKHYALMDPITLAMAGAAIPDEARLDKLRVVELSALESFADGAATLDDLKNLEGMGFIARALAELGCGAEALPTVKYSLAALERAEARFSDGEPMTASRTDLQTLRNLYDYHDLQRTAVARSVYEVAIAKGVTAARALIKKRAARQAVAA